MINDLLYNKWIKYILWSDSCTESMQAPRDVEMKHQLNLKTILRLFVPVPKFPSSMSIGRMIISLLEIAKRKNQRQLFR